MNHQTNLLDSLALPVHHGLYGVVHAVVPGCEGVVEGDVLIAVTRLHYGEPSVVVPSLIGVILQSIRNKNIIS